jgi:3-dehydroquinate synthase
MARAGELLQPILARPKTITVTDKNVADLYLDQFVRSLMAHDIENQSIILPAGERTKSFKQLEKLLEELLDLGVERGDIIIALGGGVIGDMAGFAASILRRGIAFAQIPTTLLAQVDASVGGKTGINTAQGKNLVGTFYQPKIVLSDLDTLKTLSRREFLSGYAEVLKYALLGDLEFFEWLEVNAQSLLAGEEGSLFYAVKKACAAKAIIVEADERESGQRALLNLGHTFGHALEAATGYGEALTHGEAVAIGQCLAFSLSHDLGHCTEKAVKKVREHVSKIGLPCHFNKIAGHNLNADRLLSHISQDKKIVDEKLTFILVRGIGEAFISQDVPDNKLRDFLEKMVQS